MQHCSRQAIVMMSLLQKGVFYIVTFPFLVIALDVLAADKWYF
jgi:hypothetical protein